MQVNISAIDLASDHLTTLTYNDSNFNTTPSEDVKDINKTSEASNSPLWKDYIEGPPNAPTEDQYFYSMNTTINNTVIVLQNASVFISNAVIIDTKITTNGIISYAVSIQNCTFEGSELEIDSARNVSISFSSFIIRNVSENHEPTHTVRVYNTDIVFVSNTLFGNQTKGHTGNKALMTEGTNLGIKIENVPLAEIRECTFSGIKSDVSRGTVMYLKSTSVLMISCVFYSNRARYGVIQAIGSVNLENNNCSFISNHVVKYGGVFYMSDFCNLTNYDCIFQTNIADRYGAVLYGKKYAIIKNTRCLFQYNAADTGGVFFMKDFCTNLNYDCIFQNNSAKEGGGVFYTSSGNITNNNCSHMSNYVGKYGAVFYMKDFSTLKNYVCISQNNTAGENGGVVYGKNNVIIKNTRCLFQYNTAETGYGSVIRIMNKCQIVNQQV